jgi:hypothetical protein
LDATIGLMMFEWAQPMDRPPFELSTHGGHLRKLAEISAQPGADRVAADVALLGTVAGHARGKCHTAKIDPSTGRRSHDCTLSPFRNRQNLVSRSVSD